MKEKMKELENVVAWFDNSSFHELLRNTYLIREDNFEVYFDFNYIDMDVRMEVYDSINKRLMAAPDYIHKVYRTIEELDELINILSDCIYTDVPLSEIRYQLYDKPSRVYATWATEPDGNYVGMQVW